MIIYFWIWRNVKQVAFNSKKWGMISKRKNFQHVIIFQHVLTCVKFLSYVFSCSYEIERKIYVLSHFYAKISREVFYYQLYKYWQLFPYSLLVYSSLVLCPLLWCCYYCYLYACLWKRIIAAIIWNSFVNHKHYLWFMRSEFPNFCSHRFIQMFLKGK